MKKINYKKLAVLLITTLLVNTCTVMSNAEEIASPNNAGQSTEQQTQNSGQQNPDSTTGQQDPTSEQQNQTSVQTGSESNSVIIPTTDPASDSASDSGATTADEASGENAVLASDADGEELEELGAEPDPATYSDYIVASYSDYYTKKIECNEENGQAALWDFVEADNVYVRESFCLGFNNDDDAPYGMLIHESLQASPHCAMEALDPYDGKYNVSPILDIDAGASIIGVDLYDIHGDSITSPLASHKIFYWGEIPGELPIRFGWIEQDSSDDGWAGLRDSLNHIVALSPNGFMNILGSFFEADYYNGESTLEKYADKVGLNPGTGSNQWSAASFADALQGKATLSVIAARGSSITATDSSGNPIILEKKQYRIELSSGSDVFTYDFNCIEIPQTGGSDNVLIRVGMEDDNCEFFLRRPNVDDSPVIGSIDNTKALSIYSDKFDGKDGVSLIGNGSYFNSDEDMSDESAENYYAGNFQSAVGNGKLAVFGPDFVGITVLPSGKDNPLAWEVNSEFALKEASSDSSAQTNLYFGYKTIDISGYESASSLPTAKTIATISVADEDIPSDAVTISGNKITFNSDYYTAIPLKIEYSDGDIVYITINRVGIVMQTRIQSGGTEFKFLHGHDDSEYTVQKASFSNASDYIIGTYYYPATGSVTEDVSLFVKLTYRDRVETKVVESSYFTAQKNNVLKTTNAMSDFVIFAGDEDKPVKVEAIAVPKADANGRYYGAKLGAGAGVSYTCDWD